MLPSTLTLESYFVAIAYISIIITYLGIKVMKMFHVGKFITIFFSQSNYMRPFLTNIYIGNPSICPQYRNTIIDLTF